MGKCIIICPLWHGERLDDLTPAQDDLLLCADAGLYAALEYGLKPHLAIGDFDTLPPPTDNNVPLQLLPVAKDDTDLGACIHEGRRRSLHSFLLAGCMGGRIDHTMAMLQLMADCALQGEICTAIDGINTVTILAPGTHVLPAREGHLLSLLSFSDQVTDICLSGTEWPLEHAVLSQRFPLGISNRITSTHAVLSFSSGLLLVCYARNSTWMGTSN